MNTALSQKFPFILDRNLAKANCTGNRECTSCDTVVLVQTLKRLVYNFKLCDAQLISTLFSDRSADTMIRK